jgi:hypothetical protein
MAIGDEQWERHAREWAHKNAWRWDGTITQAEKRVRENVDRLHLLYLWTAVGQAAKLKQNEGIKHLVKVDG